MVLFGPAKVMTGLGEYCRCVLDWLSSTLRLISTSTLWTARVQKCREYFARQTPFVKYLLHCRVKVLYARNFAPGTRPQECSIRFFLKSTRGCTNVLKAPVLAVVVITNIQGRNYHRVSYLLNMYAVTCALVAIRGEVHVGCTRLPVGLLALDVGPHVSIPGTLYMLRWGLGLYVDRCVPLQPQAYAYITAMLAVALHDSSSWTSWSSEPTDPRAITILHTTSN